MDNSDTHCPAALVVLGRRVLRGLFSVSDPCCVKKGNEYPACVLILFFSREDKITSLRCPALNSLPRLLYTIICYSGFEKQNKGCLYSVCLFRTYFILNTQSCFFADLLHLCCCLWFLHFHYDAHMFMLVQKYIWPALKTQTIRIYICHPNLVDHIHIWKERTFAPILIH